jgi:hypothetical protein
LVKFVELVGLVAVMGEIYGNYKEVRRPGVLAGSQEIRKTDLRVNQESSVQEGPRIGKSSHG